MTEPYTPTTGDVRNGYTQRGGRPKVFDRWLDRHDIEVKAAALREAADGLAAGGMAAAARVLIRSAERIERRTDGE